MATKQITEVVRVGKRGALELSRRVRTALALQEGDELVLSVEDDKLVLRRKAKRFAEYLNALAPSRDRN